MTYFMPSFCITLKADTSIVLKRIWNYDRNYGQSVKGLQQNVYLRYGFSTIRRNPTLFLVPTMYVIAKGDRDYIGESYNKVKFQNVYDYKHQRQVKCGTIPRHRTAMDGVLRSITPNFYNETLYPDHILSPFHHSNQKFYEYIISPESGGLAIVRFQPKSQNTQLISGRAVVDFATGRLQSVYFQGEFDMIKFKVSALMNQKDLHTPLPERCSTEATFRFLGNHIKAHCTAVYNCPTTLPDSIHEKADRKLMEELRPIPLSTQDQRIYAMYDEQRRKDSLEAAADTMSQKKDKYDWIKEVGWDLIGDNLLNGNGTTKKTQSGSLTMRFSPLLNPLYFGYSHSHGFSYKLRLGARYSWNTHRYLTFEPSFGYNFKLKQIFYTIPLRMTYNPKRNGYAEIRFGNGNRISNSSLANDFRKIMKDSVRMPEYNDRYIKVVNNVVAYDWLEIMTGIVYHHRESIDPVLMKKAGMKDHYSSFAPLLTLRFTPWHHGPTLTANYERGLQNVLHSNLNYERMEFDAAYMLRLKSMRIVNFRAGTGFYTHRNSDYFVVFSNFHDENLASGWEDDWTGQFQLLNSTWYNESNYYIRGHVSYDSPMLALSHIPFLGRHIETERIYLSALGIQRTRPYFEVGYGFTNRFFSTAVFFNFLNWKIQEVGFKFTIEIFRRW